MTEKSDAKIAVRMTDADIGRTVRKIAEQGFNVIVKKKRNGIIILREKCEIVEPDKKQ